MRRFRFHYNSLDAWHKAHDIGIDVESQKVGWGLDRLKPSSGMLKSPLTPRLEQFRFCFVQSRDVTSCCMSSVIAGQHAIHGKPLEDSFAPELLLEVFDYLSLEDLCNASLVCQAWSEHAITTTWKISTIQLSQLLSKLFCFKKHEKCEVRYWYYLPPMAWPTLTSLFNLKLRQLISQSSPIAETQWTTFQKFNHKVRTIDIDISLAPAALDHLRGQLRQHDETLCPNAVAVTVDVKSLCIDHAKTLSGKKLWIHTLALLSNPQLLTTLEIGGESLNDNDTMAALDFLLPSESFDKDLPRLRSLTAWICDQDTCQDLMGRIQESGTTIEELSVDVHHGMDLYEMKDVMKMAGLRKLVMTSPAGIAMQDKDLSKFQSCLPQLTHLTIGKPSAPRCLHRANITVWGLKCLAGEEYNLEESSISIQDEIPVWGPFQGRLPVGRDRFPALRRLEIPHLGIGDESYNSFAKWLAKFCPFVEELEVDCLSLGGRVVGDKAIIRDFVKAFFEAQKRVSKDPPPKRVDISALLQMGNSPESLDNLRMVSFPRTLMCKRFSPYFV